MPLDSDDWEEADRKLSEYRDLLAFLREHPEMAFRPGELVGTISGEFSTAIERERCKMHLETLVELGKVEKRRHADRDLIYYRIAPEGVEGTRSVRENEVRVADDEADLDRESLGVGGLDLDLESLSDGRLDLDRDSGDVGDRDPTAHLDGGTRLVSDPESN